MEASEQQAERWLQWWHQGYWQQADESWHINGFFALPAEQQQALAWQHPLAVAAGFDIRPALPPAPQARLLTLVSLPDACWGRLLTLLAGVCAPHRAPDELSAANRIWCRRLTKALRCESWLDEACFYPYTTGSLLLLHTLSPACWPRLRLRFPREWVKQVSEYPVPDLPESRLAALWDAVIWQSQQPEKMIHVDPQENPLTE
ncbi:serine kinase [Erwinia tasmaniensis]|uniref:serine kinase n=1 Tax=Erwinia tasmaniensis TaxID=338565 RepID=UPI003A4E304B